ncbi:hypothetical protein Plhal710r2_c051g0158561 [Plasmopara halstedii]
MTSAGAHCNESTAAIATTATTLSCAPSFASTWAPEHRCLAVAAEDEGAESADCVEGKNRTSIRTSEANSDLAPVIAGPVEDVELADGKEDGVAMPQEVRALPMTDIIILPEAAQSTKRTEELGMRLRLVERSPRPRQEEGMRACRPQQFNVNGYYRVRVKDGWPRRRGLEEDGNTQDCNFVDAWYDVDKCRTKPFCSGYRFHSKAGEDADSVRLAVNARYERKGRSPLVSREDWETFLRAKSISLDKGFGVRKLGVLLNWIEEKGMHLTCALTEATSSRKRIC